MLQAHPASSNNGILRTQLAVFDEEQQLFAGLSLEAWVVSIIIWRINSPVAGDLTSTLSALGHVMSSRRARDNEGQGGPWRNDPLPTRNPIHRIPNQPQVSRSDFGKTAMSHC